MRINHRRFCDGAEAVDRQSFCDGPSLSPSDVAKATREAKKNQVDAGGQAAKKKRCATGDVPKSSGRSTWVFFPCDAGGEKNPSRPSQPSRRGRTSGEKKKVCHRGCPEIERQRTQLGRPPRESLVSHPWCEMESSTLAMRLFGANPMRSGSLGRRTPRLSCALAIESSAGSGVEGCCCGEELQEDTVMVRRPRSPGKRSL